MNCEFSTHQIISTFILFFFFAMGVSGQEEPETYQYRKYVNEEAFRLTSQNFKDLQLTQFEIDKKANARARGIKIKKTTLPVVFNVVYNGSDQQVTEDQILSQIEALNRDFSLENKTASIPAELAEGFHNVKASKLDIQFCLPHKNGKKDDTIGINYHESNSKQYSLEDVIIGSKDFDFAPWDPDKFINVWIVDFEKDITGFAQRPGGPERTDGIFIDYRFFGVGGNTNERFNEGKTLTHLMGNYLGLKDLWGERTCIDDDISDTPIHNGPNYGCPTYKHVSTCSKENVVEMTMNFMDNTDDACMYMFTVGQMLRMHATIAEGGIRHGLQETKTGCNNGKSKDEDLEPFDEIGEPNTWVFPNPASTEINVNVTANVPGHTYIMIYDAVGNTIYDKNFSTIVGDHIEQINSSGWSSGIYFIHTNVNEYSSIERIILTNE